MKKKFLWALLAVPALILLAQLLYYTSVIRQAPPPLTQAGLILVYSGGEDRITSALKALDGPTAPLFLFSGYEYDRKTLARITRLPADKLLVETRARTTDQNARYSRPLILGTGETQAVLALPWYQLPRALFLTRLYLWGTGVTVVPYATFPPTPSWWRSKVFRLEFMKFWGSLFRMVLAAIGIEEWPTPWSLRSPKIQIPRRAPLGTDRWNIGTDDKQRSDFRGPWPGPSWPSSGKRTGPNPTPSVTRNHRSSRSLRSQFVTLENERRPTTPHPLRSQIATLEMGKGRHRKYPPLALPYRSSSAFIGGQ